MIWEGYLMGLKNLTLKTETGWGRVGRNHPHHPLIRVTLANKDY